MKHDFARRVAAVLVAAAFGVACVTNPVTGKSQLSLMGEEEEKQLGAQSYGPMIQESYGSVTDPGLQRYLDGVGQGLAQVSHRPALEYQFVGSMEILQAAHDREPSKLEAMFQSHPLTTERIETRRRRAQEKYANLLGNPYRVEKFDVSTRNLRAEAPAFALVDEGEKLLAKKDARGAAAKFDEVARLAPRQAILPALKAIALVEAKELRLARDAAREAERRDPSLFHGRLAGGLSAYQLSDWRDAIGELEAAEKAAGAQLVTTYYLGRSYEGLGDRAKAIEKFKLIAQSGAAGEQADYAKGRLLEWGVVSQAPQPQSSPR